MSLLTDIAWAIGGVLFVWSCWHADEWLHASLDWDASADSDDDDEPALFV